MSRLFEADYFSWARAQADALRRRAGEELDWETLAGELDALGANEENELYSRHVVLCAHLLKWLIQPGRRSRSWANTILEQRRRIARRLRRSPGLNAEEAQSFLDAYGDARLRASSETDLPLESFPEVPPFTLEEAKREDYWP